MLMDHENGKKLLLGLNDLLIDLGIPHFLIQGTALGAYRDKGFVPTEKDIDIGILQEHLCPLGFRQSTAHTLFRELLYHAYDVEAFVQPFTRIKTIVAYKYGCKADLVGLVKWQDKRFTSTPVRNYITEPYCIVHDAAMLETYEEVELFGRKFKVPSPIEKYLELEYGPDWRVPQDDHESRTRIYDFINKEGIPSDYLESKPVLG